LAKRPVFVILFFSGFLLQCRQEKSAMSAMSVFVSILPQKNIVEKIGGKFVDVSVMVLPGSSPHSYEPRASQMAALSRARVYFSIGLEFEKVWLPRFSGLSGALAVIPMDSGIAKRQPDGSCGHEEKNSREPEPSNRHAGLDPHIWLSPELVKKLAGNVYESLRRIDPAHDSAYSANLAAYRIELTALQDSIRAIVSPGNTGEKRSFLVFHPSWAYFAEEFHLRQIAIEIEGKEPSARQLQAIIDTAQKSGITTIFVQPQFSRRSAEIIARQIKGRIHIADDLAYDIRGNLIAFAKAVATQ
jgi:zinc transport system substrate-binding protein